MHFTYEEASDQHLQQGDIIRRTDEIETLLQSVHPHYHATKNYQFFIVLTQSCDLVRRSGAPCKSRYITIAAVRPLRLVLERETEKLQHSSVERKLRFCGSDKQIKLVQFLERLLNNNEDDYFYLHREPSVGIDEDHCAFLHLSISVKSELHYSKLMAARVVSLQESFQHKLGYLVGALYARVGTEDWVPNNCLQDAFRELTEKPLEDPNLVLWVDKEIHKKVIKRLKQVPDPKEEDLKQAISDAKASRENRKAKVLEMVSSVLEELKLPAETVSTVRQRLDNLPDFKLILK